MLVTDVVSKSIPYCEGCSNSISFDELEGVCALVIEDMGNRGFDYKKIFNPYFLYISMVVGAIGGVALKNYEKKTGGLSQLLSSSQAPEAQSQSVKNSSSSRESYSTSSSSSQQSCSQSSPSPTKQA
jgi:hypothetical protein